MVVEAVFPAAVAAHVCMDWVNGEFLVVVKRVDEHGKTDPTKIGNSPDTTATHQEGYRDVVGALPVGSCGSCVQLATEYSRLSGVMGRVIVLIGITCNKCALLEYCPHLHHAFWVGDIHGFGGAGSKCVWEALLGSIRMYVSSATYWTELP